MAKYTKTISGNPSSGRYTYGVLYYNKKMSGSKTDKSVSFTFDLSSLKNKKITGFEISFKTTPKTTTSGSGVFIQGSKWKYEINIGNYTDTGGPNAGTLGYKYISDYGLDINASNAKLTIIPYPTNTSWNDSVGGLYEYFYSNGEIDSMEMEVEYEEELSVNALFPLSGDRIAKSITNTFSWESQIPESSALSNHKLYWKQTTAPSYNEINVGKELSYTFPANTFENGAINWYVTAYDNDGNVSRSPVQTVNTGITPSLILAYPTSVNVKNNIAQVFTWEMQESIATGQKSYELSYREKTNSTWTTLQVTSNNQYHYFDANIFTTSEYEWRLKVTNNDNNSSDYVYSEFNAIGTTDAPSIFRVTNSAIPTFEWTVTSQDTFELEIYDSTKRLYASGIQVGSNIRAFTPNVMLKNGNYIVKMRAMNEYGYFTEWTDYAFVLNALTPYPYGCYIYANEFIGVNITRAIYHNESEFPWYDSADIFIDNQVYVLRKKHDSDEEYKIIGKLSDNDEYAIVSDNTPINGVAYDYIVRRYAADAGYADSEAKTIIISYSGFVIYKGNQFINLYKTEDEVLAIDHKPTKIFAYSNTIGRQFPIKETAEWQEHHTEVSCFATFEQYKILEEFFQSGEELWYKDKNFSFKASIDALNIRSAVLDKGFELSISISRIDENEVELF